MKTNHQLHKKMHLASRIAFVWILVFGMGPNGLYAQPGVSLNDRIEFSYKEPGDSSNSDGDGEEEYEEILLTLNVQRIGSIEIASMIYKEEAYLPVKDLFDFLRIRNIPSPDFDLIQGFFIEPLSSYVIDHNNSRITYQYKTFPLDAGSLIRTENNLYLRSDYFGKIFGLDCHFDFRSLSVTLTTKIELPIIREMQMELMRKNISSLKGEKKADTTIGRSFPFFNIGMADWSVLSSQESKNKTSTRLNLGLGGILAGGELNLSLNYFSDQPNTMRQQFYQWRYVDNDHAPLRQISLGKVMPQSIASLFAPVIGVQLTNTATTYKKSFGTYTISNTTQPGWTVELYVNNVLVNYTKADASGFFTFEVPMVYGSSMIRLRFYGPWGEEQSSEKYINIPYNFIGVNQLEYSVTGGVVENDQKSKYVKANLNYGLGRSITIGGGVEYVSTLAKGRIMPYVNASMRLTSNLLFSAEHVYSVRNKAVLNYRTRANLQVDLSYTRYERNQLAVRMDFLEERKAIVTMPIRSKKFNAFTRLTLNQFTLPYSYLGDKPGTRYTSGELLFSGVFAGISNNLTTYAMFNKSGNPLVYSNYSLNYRFRSGFRINPQAQYEYRLNKFSKLKIEVEKNIFNRGFANVSYERNMVGLKNNIFTVGLRYNFSFAQTFFSAGKDRNGIRTVQSAKGSIMYDRRSGYVGTNNQSQVGRGGIIVKAFLDLNGNKLRDKNEPALDGIKLHINGGRIEPDHKDSSIRISGLEAYTSYYIEIDKNSFDNISWQIKKPVIKVIADPNQFKHIDVPVSVYGEVSGFVKIKSDAGTSGIGRIIVNIHNAEGKLVSKVISEQDGYFSYLGLAPGTYRASIDPMQLEKLGYKTKAAFEFDVNSTYDGDVIDGIELVLEKR